MFGPNKTIARLVFLSLTVFAGSARPEQTEQGSPQALAEVIRRIVSAENALRERLRDYHPLVETYIQGLAEDDKLGAVPKEDEYFLGKLQLRGAVRTNSLLPRHGVVWSITGALKQPFPMKMRYILDSFPTMILVDTAGLDENRYEFRFVRREFLGEARCLAFDVKPQGKKREGFTGRIWVEDRDFTIVRFNGSNSSLGDRDLHFDSWRLHLGPGIWLPALVYSEESDLPYGLIKTRKARFKAQTRLWSYAPKKDAKAGEFTAISVDDLAARDRSDDKAPLSPVLSQRSWERQAEENVIERLERAGLLAPRGDVDKVLETVVHNLEITNQVSIEPEVRCRVLLTSPLESFTVGRTIVLSRGLIDVLPDEATLAAMLAHELGHVLLGHLPVDTKFAFADRMLVEDTELLESFRFRRKPAEESAADAKAFELLQKSPYKDKLGDAGLFLRAVASRAKQLPNLIRPHLGDRLARGGDVLRLGQMLGAAPKLEMERIDQVAALPLGGRIQVDSWTNRIDLLKTKPAGLVSAREKMPLEITPFVPYVGYRQGARAPEVRASQNPVK
ncbi:MAG: hypothetical protein DMG07_03440 [Acidobacteria bacterium]|nr:MAG: hypothetical protein DMG07_03440 [Acidobacteriota bacterium]